MLVTRRSPNQTLTNHMAASATNLVPELEASSWASGCPSSRRYARYLQLGHRRLAVPSVALAPDHVSIGHRA